MPPCMRGNHFYNGTARGNLFEHCHYQAAASMSVARIFPVNENQIEMEAERELAATRRASPRPPGISS